jgi:hypothetical protein
LSARARLEISSEGLLDDHSAPAAGVLTSQRGGAELADDFSKEAGSGRQVVKVVALCPVVAVDLDKHSLETLIRCRIPELARQVIETPFELVPQLRPDLGRHEVAVLAADLLAEVVRAHFGTSDANDREIRRQQVVGCEVIERWYQLTFGEIARSSKNDHHARTDRQCGRLDFSSPLLHDVRP